MAILTEEKPKGEEGGFKMHQDEDRVVKISYL